MNFFRKQLPYWLFLTIALFIASCSNENEPVIPKEETQGQLHTDVSGAKVVNTGKIVIGLDDNDLAYTRIATILKPNGWKQKNVIDCSGMFAIPLVAGENKEDTLRSVDNATLINLGTIEIHTKKLVEKYKSVLYDPENSDPQEDAYEYLRFFGITSTGANCTLINEGLIDVYLDHDPNTPLWVYCFAMAGSEDSQIINNGTIRFRGNGSRRTRVRGIGIMGNGATGINEGTIEMNIAMAEDSRMITCGTDHCDIINNGIMKARVPGTLLGLTHYGLNTIVNNNLIDLTSTPIPEGARSILDDNVNIVTAFYEAFNKSRRDGIPPLVNKGTVNIRIEGATSTAESFQGYGMMVDMISDCNRSLTIVNEGTIKTSQSGPIHYNMAEAGFICREDTKEVPCHIVLSQWNTTLRDFSRTRDLFLAKGVDMDFSAGDIRLTKPEGYVDGTFYSIAPEHLMYNAGEGNDFIYEYHGYDQMIFSAADSHTKINWNKENQTISLTK